MAGSNGTDGLIEHTGSIAGYLVAGFIFAIIIWSVIRTILLHT